MQTWTSSWSQGHQLATTLRCHSERGPLHLTGETGDSALSLRDAILISLYPESDDKEYENRFLGMKGSEYWVEHVQ